MGSIGKRILDLRKQLNLSQKELAERTGITEATLSRYENNLREPKAEIITKISDVLECSTDYLLGRTDNKKDYTKCNNSKTIVYKKMEEKIMERLSDEGIIEKNQPINQYIADKVVKYGIEATIEILKLEKDKVEK